MIVGLDTASNRWHAVTSEGTVGFCSELKNKEWDCQVKKPPKKKPVGVDKDDHRRAHDEYQAALRESLDKKRKELARTFGGWLARTALTSGDPIHIYCEEPLALQNPATTRVLSLAAGALFDEARVVAEMLGHEVTWVWIDVAHWKRVVVGNGNADKDKIADHVVAIADLSKIDASVFVAEEDLYDAWCLCEYGKRAMEAGERPVTLAR